MAAGQSSTMTGTYAGQFVMEVSVPSSLRLSDRLLQGFLHVLSVADVAGDERKSMIESIIVEVSNTPWIEQHSYMLDESVPNVSHSSISYGKKMLS